MRRKFWGGAQNETSVPILVRRPFLRDGPVGAAFMFSAM